MPGLRTKRLPVILVLVGIVSMLAAACGGGEETNPEKLIPDGSNLVAQVNVNGLLASNGWLSLASTVTADMDDPTSIDDLLEDVLEATGVDLRQFSQAAFFTDIGRNEEFTGLIAKGNFDELALISSLRRAVDALVVSAPYKDMLIYSAEDDSDPPSFSILGDGILVIGTREAVRAVIDVQQGDRERVSGDLIEAFNDLGGGMLRLEVAVPADFIAENLPFFLASLPALGDALSGEGAAGLFGAVENLRDLEFVGLSLAQNGQIFILRTNLEFTSQESAESVSGLLTGLITLGLSFSPDPALTELLKELEVRHDEGQVSIRLETDRTEIADIISSLITTTQSETSVTQEPALRNPRGIPLDETPEPQRIPRIAALGDEIPIMPTSLHVAIGEEVDYSTTPPTSGDHWQRWADCGFYPEGLTDEIITHNLEHGNIVVNYNLTLEGQIAPLRALIGNIPSSDNWGVTRFYDEIPEGQIVLSAWGRMYRTRVVDQLSMEAFFTLYAGELGPERIPC